MMCCSFSIFQSCFILFLFYQIFSFGYIECFIHEIVSFGGETASLPCEIDINNDNCREIDQITWYKNVSNEWIKIYSYNQGYHKPLDYLDPERLTMDDTSVTINNKSNVGLKIKSIRFTDEGDYKCNVTFAKANCQSSSTYSKLFTLGSNNHLRPPRITEHPSDTIVRRNDPTKLDCRADGNPSPTIEWYKDGKKIGKHHNRMALPTGSLFFLHVIHNKKDPDTGTYWCVARNEIGKAISRNATLNYAFLREEFKTVPKSVAVVSGDRVILECLPPRGYPEPKVHWKKDGRPVSLTTPRIKLVPGGSLRITDVRPHDQGRYTCIAENSVATKESPPALLEVSVKPYLIRSPENISALSGETVEFSCKVGGEPPPYITWTKKDGKIAFGRIQIKEDKTLRIREVKPSDGGVYICEAVNQGGHISASASLSVDCIPSDLITPSKLDQVPTSQPDNLRVAVLNETAAQITWSPLSIDVWRGDPVAYFVRLMSTDHHFCSHFNITPYQTDLTLNNLVYGETYEITVAALTTAGLGPFASLAPLHMVIGFTYNWQTGSGSSSNSLIPDMLKDHTHLHALTKEPVFIFSAILALFVLSFIILILFARRHINWNKSMGAYITVQLNKCDDIDNKYSKSNYGANGSVVGGSRTESNSLNPSSNGGYWLSSDKTKYSSSSEPPKPVNQDYPKSSKVTSSAPPINDLSSTVDVDETNGLVESDYAEVEERTLMTFGKRGSDYAASTEPYATTTLMKSFRGSTENTSSINCSNGLGGSGRGSKKLSNGLSGSSNGLISRANGSNSVSSYAKSLLSEKQSVLSRVHHHHSQIKPTTGTSASNSSPVISESSVRSIGSIGSTSDLLCNRQSSGPPCSGRNGDLSPYLTSHDHLGRTDSSMIPSNVTVHCQYPIVLGSSSPYFEKYL